MTRHGVMMPPNTVILPEIERQAYLTEIGGHLQQFEDLDIAYVIGSFIERETYRDLDLMIVVSPHIKRGYEQHQIASRVGWILESRLRPRIELDVRVINDAPIAFQHRVLSRGRQIYEREPVRRVRYEAGVLAEYLDAKEWLERLDEQYLMRAEYG